MTHFKLFFAFGIRWMLSFIFSVHTSYCFRDICWEDCPFPMELLWHLCKKWLYAHLYRGKSIHLLFNLCFIPLIKSVFLGQYGTVLITVLYSKSLNSVVWVFQLKKNVSVILSSFHFHINTGITNFYKEENWIWTGIVIDL